FDLFFFFQAEDGIRDLYVTGVQTCALPIWSAGLLHAEPLRFGAGAGPSGSPVAGARAGAGGGSAAVRRPRWHVADGRNRSDEGRSEERREGKSVELGGRGISKEKKEEEREK